MPTCPTSTSTVCSSRTSSSICSSQEQVTTFLEKMYAVMAPGGRIAVMGPNFRYCAAEYFDMADHTLIFTHMAIAEHLYTAGFEPERVIPRYLPYSFRGRLPPSPTLTRRYLATPPAWRLLGKQFLLIGQSLSAMGARRVLITGGAGFIGSSLALALRAAPPRLGDRGAATTCSGAARSSTSRASRRPGRVRPRRRAPSRRPRGVSAMSTRSSSAAPSRRSWPRSTAARSSSSQTNLVGAYHCLELAARTAPR